MTEWKNRPEVLAPAGSMDALRAAVLCGADAVYLGATRFSARQNAANFSAGDESGGAAASLREAVAFCHVRGVRVYLTMNTLIREDEMDDALRLAEDACRAGVDALIVQDRGFARRMRAAAPDMPLHASTQLSCHTPGGVAQLREAGFARVVLAREMAEEEIAACAGLGCELEVFVHGALCRSVSGQCYLSGLLGGRSGNRGLCAQPCRLPFAAGHRPGPEDRALSLKDLCLRDHVATLSRIGVASLKIEGRMKRPEYVAAATAVFAALARGEEPDELLLEDLQKVFSRSGFTDGYFSGRRGRDLLGSRRKEDVTAADAATLARLARLYDKETPRVAVDWRLRAEAGFPAVLFATDGIHTAEAKGPVPEPAVNRPLDQERAAAQLQKTGGTPFFTRKTDCRIGEGLTLPLSALNALRREALAGLETLRDEPPAAFFRAANRPAAVSPVPPPFPISSRPFLLARAARTAQLVPGADGWVLPAEAWAAPPVLPREANAAGVEIPRALFGRENRVLAALQTAKTNGAAFALCGHADAVALARRAGLAPVGGFGMNLYNLDALCAMAEDGLSAALLSMELTFRQMDFAKQAPLPAGLFAYGRQPLMLLRDCPRQMAAGCSGGRDCVLTDRKGVSFPLVCDAGGTELLNAVPLYLADRLSALPPMDFLYLHFTDEPPDEVSRILRDYRMGAAAPPPAYTRGLYTRGVL